MLEASRFTIEKKIKPILEELEKEKPDWEELYELWSNRFKCGFCEEWWESGCEDCPLYIELTEMECHNQDWYEDISYKLYNHDLTVFGDIIDVWYCYENL